MTRFVYVLPAGRFRWEVRVERPKKCPAVLNLNGQHFPCQQLDRMGTLDGSPATSHEGWPHSNRDAQAIWLGDEVHDRPQFYRRKSRAMDAARAIAIIIGGEVQPHDRRGRIQDPDSYGPDPRESAG